MIKEKKGVNIMTREERFEEIFKHDRGYWYNLPNLHDLAKHFYLQGCQDNEYILFKERAEKLEMNKNIFISFIEEAVMHPDYSGFIGGRIEVSKPGDHFPSEEIRFFTKDIDSFNQFREIWDMRDVTKEQLDFIKNEVASGFYER